MSSSSSHSTLLARTAKKFRCIECGHAANHIYHSTKQGRVSLSTCDRCHNICDKYVEYDFALLLLDLLLHKKQAIRHLLFNYHHIFESGVSCNNSRFGADLWTLTKIVSCSVVLKACIYFNNGSVSGASSSTHLLSSGAHNVPIFYHYLLGSFLETLLYIAMLLFLIGTLVSRFVRFRYHFMCILLSCFVDLGFAPMLIWDYSKLFQASIVILHWSMTVLSCSVVVKDPLPAVFTTPLPAWLRPEGSAPNYLSYLIFGVLVGVSMLASHLTVWYVAHQWIP